MIGNMKNLPQRMKIPVIAKATKLIAINQCENLSTLLKRCINLPDIGSFSLIVPFRTNTAKIAPAAIINNQPPKTVITPFLIKRHC